MVYGAPLKSRLFNDDRRGIPIIRIRDLSHHSPGVYTTEQHPRGYLVQPGDVVVGMDGEFRAHIWRGPEAWLNQRVCCFRPLSSVPAFFLKMSIERPLKFFEYAKSGTTVIHLGKKDIDTFRLLKPRADVLRAFGGIVEPLRIRIIGLAAQSRTLAALRDTLLTKLLSGELEVPDAEAVVEEVAK